MQTKKTTLKYVIVIGAFILFGCAAMTKGYGTFVPDQIALQNLEAFQIDPDMNYYFSGPFGRPNAIIGVHKSYTLNSPLWKKIVVTPELVRAFVSSVKSRPLEMSLHSYAMLDDKGKKIGVWYSTSSDFRSYIKMEDERTVYIATPANPAGNDLGPL